MPAYRMRSIQIEKQRIIVNIRFKRMMKFDGQDKFNVLTFEYIGSDIGYMDRR